MKKLVWLFCFLACALPTEAQDFAQFTQSFPIQKIKPEKWVFDSAYFAQCERDLPALKPIPPVWVRQHIINHLYTPEQIKATEIAQNKGEGVPTDLKIPKISTKPIKPKDQPAQYYFLQKIDLMPNFTNLLVYYVDKGDKNGNLSNKCVLLFHYDRQGKLVRHYRVMDLFLYTDWRFHFTEIDQKLQMVDTEVGYNYQEQKNLPAYPPTFSLKTHYQINPHTAEYTSTQAQFYPYSGRFICEEMMHLIDVEQNDNWFYLTEGKVGAGLQMGVVVSEYDVAKGTFKAVLNGEECIGTFSEDKNSFKLMGANYDCVYKRSKD